MPGRHQLRVFSRLCFSGEVKLLAEPEDEGFCSSFSLYSVGKRLHMQGSHAFGNRIGFPPAGLTHMTLARFPLFEVIGEAEVKTGAWAGWEASTKYAERKGKVIQDRVTPSNLSFQLSARQIEIVGHTAEQFGAEL